MKEKEIKMVRLKNILNVFIALAFCASLNAEVIIRPLNHIHENSASYLWNVSSSDSEMGSQSGSESGSDSDSPPPKKKRNKYVSSSDSESGSESGSDSDSSTPKKKRKRAASSSNSDSDSLPPKKKRKGRHSSDSSYEENNHLNFSQAVKNNEYK